MIRANGKLAITPGIVYIGRFQELTAASGQILVSGVSMPCGVHPQADEAKGNGLLLMESINVTNECGRTPRELLDLCRELRMALQRLHWKCSSAERPDHAERRASESALAKSEGI